MEKTFKVLVVLFAVVGIGLFGYHWFSQWHSKTVDQSLQQEKEKHLERVKQLEAEVTRLTEELEVQSVAKPSKSELVTVFGAEKPMETLTLEDMDCQKITGQVAAFFQYLDSKAYLIWPGINMRAEELFDQISKQLAAAPPVNVGEMDELHSLVGNVTHFYRVLGKNRINLMKEILNSESAVMEPAMAVLFTWIVACNNDSTQLNLKTLYQYSHFFLNTLGGRSYLLRRDAKQRMLINYYALMVIDMANDAKLNSYGLDIRPHLDYVFYDINNQKGLMYRQRYLSRLSALQNKYQ
ncbi:MAG: hypothetical protein PVJ84_12915 [Desulfobacteraceae bacterium]|jgi:hypothetical protein